MDKNNSDKEKVKHKSRLSEGVKYAKLWIESSGHEMKTKAVKPEETEQDSKKDSGDTK